MLRFLALLNFRSLKLSTHLHHVCERRNGWGNENVVFWSLCSTSQPYHPVENTVISGPTEWFQSPTMAVFDENWFICSPVHYCTFVCFAFHLCQLYISTNWQVPVLHHYTEKQPGNLCRTNVPRRPNLSVLLRRFITDSELATSWKHTCGCAHTHTHDQTQVQIAVKTSKRRKSIYWNLQCVPSCVALLWLQPSKNIKQFVSLWREGRNPLRSPASGIYGSKNSPILYINLKQL